MWKIGDGASRLVRSQVRRKIESVVLTLTVILFLLVFNNLAAHGQEEEENRAGYVPTISGGLGYVHSVDGGVTSLEPQIDPVLLVPFGRHILLESRTDFTGFFQREQQTTGPFTGKVFKTVEYAQLDWLADSHLMVTAGRYLLPFGLYNERLGPIWIKNLQDAPITATVGTRTSGSGDGGMLRGVLTDRPSYSAQYTAYFSVRSDINQLGSARVAGGDASIFLKQPRLEIGASYQRFLQQHEINSVAAYVSWQPATTPVDLKAEYDYSYYGNGYWLESAYLLHRLPIPRVFKPFQAVARMQQFFPLNGGGNELPGIRTQRFDFGLNYYVRDNLRIISSFGRTFSAQTDANIWNVGFTYRFTLPLWPGRNQ